MSNMEFRRLESRKSAPLWAAAATALLICGSLAALGATGAARSGCRARGDPGAADARRDSRQGQSRGRRRQGQCRHHRSLDAGDPERDHRADLSSHHQRQRLRQAARRGNRNRQERGAAR